MIRQASPDDADAIAALLTELEHPATPSEVARRLSSLDATGNDPVLVAELGGKVVGLVALHVASMLHHAAPVARITSLVVAADARRHGIGASLVARAVEVAKKAGCTQLELTTNERRTEAHVFYESLGFVHTSRKYRRALQ